MRPGEQKRVNASVIQVLLALFFFAPLVYLLVETLVHLVYSPGLHWLVLPIGRRFSLLMNSLKLASTVSITVTAVGVLAGSKLVYERSKRWRLFRDVFLLTAPVPPFIHALIWSGLIGNLGKLLQVWGLNLSVGGFAMSYIVNTITYLPLGVGLAMVGYALVETPSVEAARLVKEDIRVFIDVVFPLAAPMILAALGFVFILVITDYSVPALYSYSVYSLEIFSDFSATNSPTRSVLLSAPLTLITFLMLMLSLGGLRNMVQSSSVNKEKLLPRWRFPQAFTLLQLIATSFTILQPLILLGGLLLETGSAASLYYAVGGALDTLTSSTIIGVSGAILGSCFGYILSERLERGRFWWMLLLIPLTLPSATVGIALIDIYNTYLPWLYGTMIIPVIAVTTRFVAIATIIIYAQSRQVDPLLFEAAELFKRNKTQDLWRVKLPLQKYGIAAAAAMLLAFGVGELGGTLLVVPPGRETLTIRIFNYLHYGGSEEVAGLCLFIVVLMMSTAAAALKAFRRQVS